MFLSTIIYHYFHMVDLQRVFAKDNIFNWFKPKFAVYGIWFEYAN